MNRIQRGDIAEMVVATEALKNDFTVSMPISHNSRYDLIIDNGILHKVQVKRVYSVNNHGKQVRCVESKRISNKGRQCYEEGSYDYLFACDVDTNDIWILPFNLSSKYKAQIYLDSKEEYKNKWNLLGVGVSS